MIDVRGLVNMAIQQVNANITGQWIRSTGGYETDAAGKRTPITGASWVEMQVQGMESSDLRQVDGLNIQGVMRAVNLYGNASGVVRADQKGGDILRFPQAPGGPQCDWRVVKVVETWPTWCRVVVVMQ